MAGKKSSLKIKVKIVPSEGRSRTQTVVVAASGASLGEVLASGNIDTKNKDFTINGKPAALDTHVTPDDIVQAAERGKVPVAVSERPRGS